MLAKTPTTARLRFLEVAGYDVQPDPTNIPGLLAAGWTKHQVAEVYGVSKRTIDRWLNDYHPCPEPDCLTLVRGGGVCRYCRKGR